MQLTFAEALLVVRRRRHMTLRGLSRDLGCNLNYLCQLETGAREGSLELRQRIADFFDDDALRELVKGPAGRAGGCPCPDNPTPTGRDR